MLTHWVGVMSGRMEVDTHRGVCVKLITRRKLTKLICVDLESPRRTGVVSHAPYIESAKLLFPDTRQEKRRGPPQMRQLRVSIQIWLPLPRPSLWLLWPTAPGHIGVRWTYSSDLWRVEEFGGKQLSAKYWKQFQIVGNWPWKKEYRIGNMWWKKKSFYPP